MKVPILKNKRVTLRPLVILDAPNYVKWFKDKRVMMYVEQAYYNISLVDERKYIKNIIKNKGEYSYAIVNEKKVHIGGCAIHVNKKNKSARFGIIIGDKTQWGKGYAGECLDLLMGLAFTKLKLNRFDLGVYGPNKNAIRAYEKAGLIFDGSLRQAHWNQFKKIFEDEIVMSILRSEYLKKKNN